MSNYNLIYSFILFTSTNLFYFIINKNFKKNNDEIKNIVNINNTNVMRELYVTVDNIKIINNKINFIMDNINFINNMTSVVNNNDDINNKINDINFKMIDINEKLNKLINHNNKFKIDKYTSTENTFNLLQNNDSIPKNIQNEAIFIESDQDLIDDVYDYLPCQNYKKQTVYDIIINNLTK